MDHSLPLIPKAFRRGPWQGARLIDCWSDWLFWYRVTVAIHSVLWLFTKVVYLLHCMVFTWLVPHEITAVLAHVLCTACSHAHAHSVWSHIHRVHVCLAITCHQLFRQNDQDLLHATAVTRGWNRYWNKSQHRKLTLEKKILPELPPGIEPTTFRLQVRRSTTKLPTPLIPTCLWDATQFTVWILPLPCIVLILMQMGTVCAVCWRYSYVSRALLEMNISIQLSSSSRLGRKLHLWGKFVGREREWEEAHVQLPLLILIVCV